VSSRRYGKSYHKRVTGRLQTSKEWGFVYERAQNEYSTGLLYEYRARKYLKKTDTEILRTDRIPN
jgi:hypothetical protein